MLRSGTSSIKHRTSFAKGVVLIPSISNIFTNQLLENHFIAQGNYEKKDNFLQQLPFAFQLSAGHLAAMLVTWREGKNTSTPKTGHLTLDHQISLGVKKSFRMVQLSKRHQSSKSTAWGWNPFPRLLQLAPAVSFYGSFMFTWYMVFLISRDITISL